MFGIGLPEMIVIFAVALIVVGPDKLPGLARSLAKGMAEMKRSLHQVKNSLSQEGDVIDSVHQELRSTADELRAKMTDAGPEVWQLPEDKGQTEPGPQDVLDLTPVPTPQTTNEATTEAPAVDGQEFSGPEAGDHPAVAIVVPEPEQAGQPVPPPINPADDTDTVSTAKTA
jgi:sec-independent protein translocase protein TatB